MSLKNTSGVLGFQQITGISASTALTVPDTATYAIIHCTTQATRWRDDGTAPTGTVGMVLAAGGELRYDGNLKAIRFIESAVGAILNVSYYN